MLNGGEGKNIFTQEEAEAVGASKAVIGEEENQSSHQEMVNSCNENLADTEPFDRYMY